MKKEYPTFKQGNKNDQSNSKIHEQCSKGNLLGKEELNKIKQALKYNLHHTQNNRHFLKKTKKLLSIHQKL